MLGVPAEPAHHLDLAVVAGPQVGAREARKAAQNRIRLPKGPVAGIQHGHLAVRIEGEECGRSVPPLAEVDVHEGDRRVQIACDGADLPRVERLGIVKLHSGLLVGVRRGRFSWNRARSSGRNGVRCEDPGPTASAAADGLISTLLAHVKPRSPFRRDLGKGPRTEPVPSGAAGSAGATLIDFIHINGYYPLPTHNMVEPPDAPLACCVSISSSTASAFRRPMSSSAAGFC